MIRTQKLRVLLSLAVVVCAVLMIEFIWMRAQSLSGLIFVLAASMAGLVWIQYPGAAFTWPRPEADESWPKGLPPKPFFPGSLLLSLGGILLIALALLLALGDKLGWALAAIALAAACWFPLIDIRVRPVPKRWAMGLLLAALSLGSGFRLYKAGEIPMGLITVDEPRLILYTHEILDGKRESFNIRAAEGQFTFYTEALAMKVFGTDIRGFRMSAVLSGIVMIGLMAMLGIELAGIRLGLVVAGFTALALWPMTFSRAEYLMASSYMPVLGCFWLFLRGLRRASPASLLLSGFCFGLCFSVYQAGKLMPLLMLLLAGLYWLHRSDWRRPLSWALFPFACGALLTLTPLLLWVIRDPKFAYYTYFAPLFAGFSAGASLMESQSLFGKLNGAVGRILPELPKVASMFTTRGGMRPWYFMVEEPVIDRATLFLFLSGMAVCLARFRKPAFALLVAWWFIGLMPTLASNPLLNMDERRIMMSLPPTLFIASLGLLTILDLSTRNLRALWGNRIVLCACLAFFAFLGMNTWNTYFHVINRDKNFLEYNHANFDNMLRGIFRQEAKAPVSVISFRKPNEDGWWGANFENELVEHWSVLKTLPTRVASSDRDYFAKGGLFGFLKDTSPSPKVNRDPLIVLTPFHFYLEPLLTKLGGKRVEDIAPVRSKDGLNYKNVGYLLDPKTATRLIRLEDFSQAKLAALEPRWSFKYTVEELQPPAQIGTREQLRALFLLDPKHIEAIKRYDASPGSWRGGKKAEFSMPDVWFWVTANNFPENIQLPLRLKADWILNVPADGDYSLGASATVYTALFLDGKKVFSYLPETREQHDAAREGYLGKPVFLKAGPHRLALEQVAFGYGGNFNHLIRLVWQAPGGQKETLPLEVLEPLPAR